VIIENRNTHKAHTLHTALYCSPNEL